MRLGLAPAVTGASIAAVTVFDERSLRRHEGPSEDFIERLTGRGMLAPHRRGKFLWVPLAGGAEALIVHLGMSGQVLLRDQSTDDPLTRIRLDLATGYRLNFVDQRIFGSMAIDALVPAELKKKNPSDAANAAVQAKINADWYKANHSKTFQSFLDLISS